jgi:hypothetical protein
VRDSEERGEGEESERREREEREITRHVVY